MKQKSSDNNLVTKDFLKKELSKFATKTGMKQEFTAFEKRMDRKMDNRFELQGKVFRLELKLSLQETTEQVRKMLQELRNDFFTKVDPLFKNLEVARQDRIIASDQSSKLRKRVDNHEKRIKKLEQVPQSA